MSYLLLFVQLSSLHSALGQLIIIHACTGVHHVTNTTDYGFCMWQTRLIHKIIGVSLSEPHHVPGTTCIHYLSDGLETLHYRARKIFPIIVTPRSVPEMSDCTVTIAPYYGRLALSLLLWRLVGNTLVMFSSPIVVYPVDQRLNLFLVFKIMFMSVIVCEIIKHKKWLSCQVNLPLWGVLHS